MLTVRTVSWTLAGELKTKEQDHDQTAQTTITGTGNVIQPCHINIGYQLQLSVICPSLLVVLLFLRLHFTSDFLNNAHQQHWAKKKPAALHLLHRLAGAVLPPWSRRKTVGILVENDSFASLAQMLRLHQWVELVRNRHAFLTQVCTRWPEYAETLHVWQFDFVLGGYSCHASYLT